MTMDSTSKKTILVVDDENDLAQIASDILTDEGFDVVTASDGVGALRILRSGRPIHFIFSDIRMPNMDGIALLKHVREEFPSIEVCMISGYSTKSEKEVLSYGAVGYLSKPYSFEALTGIAHQHLSAKPGEPQPTSAGRHLVYVVEDETIDQELLRKAFSQLDSALDIELRFFFDGEALIKDMTAKQEVPQLIILDINLTGMSGLDAFARAKAANLLDATTKVIVLSSSKLKKDQDRAKELGVDSYFAKPMERASWWHLARSIEQSWLKSGTLA